MHENIEEIRERIQGFKNSCAEEGWDGYAAKPLKNSFLDKLVAPGFLEDCILPKFQALGFEITDIAAVPGPDEKVQFEAENDVVYVEFELSEKTLEDPLWRR